MDVYRFAGNLNLPPTRFFGFLVDIGLIILSLVTDMVYTDTSTYSSAQHNNYLAYL